MKLFITILAIFFSLGARSQSIDTIYFNLYTDSLKKGVYNYINVDGKLSSGIFQPLMADEIIFSSTAGRWVGNSLIIDTSANYDSVIVTAVLKARPEVKKSITIFLKKITVEPPLKSEQEILDSYRNQIRKRKN